MTGKMTAEMRGIRGKKAVRKPGRQSKSARKQTIKVTGNAGRKSVMPRTMHATLPGTYAETNQISWRRHGNSERVHTFGLRA
jgi:hypothetical protein